MTSEEKNKLLLSDTQVPDLFITQYMSSLSGAAIQIYLLMLLNRSASRVPVTIEILSRKMGMSAKEIEEQIFYLERDGLVEQAS